MLLATIAATAFLIAPNQTVNGVQPIFDSGPKFAQAYAKRLNDEKTLETTPDYLVVGYFIMKAKVLAPMQHTKYTAAQMGICGTILSLYDTKLSMAIKLAADRVTKGSKDFDFLTKAEVDAIEKASGDSPYGTLKAMELSKTAAWESFTGNSLGMLAAHLTIWHISPKNEILLKWLAEDVQGCADQSAKLTVANRRELVDGLRGFSKFTGKKLDAATLREVGAHLETVLKAATPQKFRW
jgi:hypothetical protein